MNMELLKSILCESLSTKGLTVLQHSILKRLNDNSLDLDNASENTMNNILYMEDKGLISDFKLTKDGIELLQLLNSVGTKDKSISKSRNRLRPKMKIGDTDINLRTGNKFRTDGKNSNHVLQYFGICLLMKYCNYQTIYFRIY